MDMRKKLGMRISAVIMVLLLSCGMMGSAYAATFSIDASDYLVVTPPGSAMEQATMS
jgi:hypothetical protein